MGRSCLRPQASSLLLRGLPSSLLLLLRGFYAMRPFPCLWCSSRRGCSRPCRSWHSPCWGCGSWDWDSRRHYLWQQSLRLAIALSIVGTSPSVWFPHWFAVDVLWRIGIGLLLGFATGKFLARLFFSARHESIRLANHSEGFVALAATFLAYGLTEMMERSHRQGSPGWNRLGRNSSRAGLPVVGSAGCRLAGTGWRQDGTPRTHRHFVLRDPRDWLPLLSCLCARKDGFRRTGHRGSGPLLAWLWPGRCSFMVPAQHPG